MKPGRELNALVAEKVMGFEVKPYESLKGVATPDYGGSLWMFAGGAWQVIPHFSTDIAAAWEVFMQMPLRHPQDKSAYLTMDRDGDGYFAVGYSDRQGDWLLRERSTEAPHAICLAALRAKGIEL